MAGKQKPSIPKQGLGGGFGEVVFVRRFRGTSSEITEGTTVWFTG